MLNTACGTQLNSNKEAPRQLQLRHPHWTTIVKLTTVALEINFRAVTRQGEGPTVGVARCKLGLNRMYTRLRGCRDMVNGGALRTLSLTARGQLTSKPKRAECLILGSSANAVRSLCKGRGTCENAAAAQLCLALEPRPIAPLDTPWPRCPTPTHTNCFHHSHHSHNLPHPSTTPSPPTPATCNRPPGQYPPPPIFPPHAW